MSYTKPRKRPCSICRKWFLPDVRQAGRQKTCSDECSGELHRRNCAKWNRKNKVLFRSNHLDKKLEKVNRSSPDLAQSEVKTDTKPPPGSRINLDLPRNIICNEIGVSSLVIMEYLVEQIFCRIRSGHFCLKSNRFCFSRRINNPTG